MDSHFGLHRRPFRPSPDPAAYCPTATHDAASAALARAFQAGEGLALVDGETGTGKTLVGLRFLDSLPEGTRRALVSVPRQTKPTELFQALLFDLGRLYQGLTEHELRLAVAGEVLAAAEQSQRWVILVDEAHNLSPEATEELRLLGNLDSPSGPPTFVVLCGLPAVRMLLAGNPSLAHRVGARCRLTPLSREESAAYLHDHLAACGGRAEWVFADEALRLLAELAGGIPRVLNRLASGAMALATDDGADLVDTEAVLTAAEQLGLAAPSTDAELPSIDAGSVEVDPLPHPNQVPRPPRGGRSPKRKAA